MVDRMVKEFEGYLEQINGQTTQITSSGEIRKIVLMDKLNAFGYGDKELTFVFFDDTRGEYTQDYRIDNKDIDRVEVRDFEDDDGIFNFDIIVWLVSGNYFRLQSIV